MSPELCLKLYDEHQFFDPQYRPDLDPAEPLYNWNVAEDMARREEAAYGRLRHLQATVLPHSFGFLYVRLSPTVTGRTLLIHSLVHIPRWPLLPRFLDGNRVWTGHEWPLHLELVS